MASIKDIEDYLQQNTRNKIVFSSVEISGITFIDAGRFLSLAILDGEDGANAVSHLFGNNYHHPSIGNYLALKNIGILFEPELKLNLRDILLSCSKNQCLIIQTDPDLMPLLDFQGLPYMVMNK